MKQIILAGLLLLSLLSGSAGLVTTLGDQVILEGRSITVPCHYDPQYIPNVKYWCQGRMKDFCTKLAQTVNQHKESAQKVSIADDPTQLVFTVTINDLKEADSGWYWCGVEVGGIWQADDATSLHISVVHGLSVVNNVVSGEEGGAVKIQCQYSERYRESQKKWCRSGDWSSCMVTDAEGHFQSKSMQITDDKSREFTVTLRNLEKKDQGWYWCAVGQEQEPVRVEVTSRTTTPSSHQALLATVAINTGLDKRYALQSPNNWLIPLLICGVFFLLVSAFLVARRWMKHYRKTLLLKEAGKMEPSLAVPLNREVEWNNTTVVFLSSPDQKASRSFKL
uniref:Ig-like domain-containing protein n=1 Tax=Denticeps clupeoides TaxID=299321 RepID=A0AAY4AWT9_9TELE